MATETRTVTDEQRVLAGVLVMEALEDYMWLPEEEFERMRQEMTEELLWTRRGRARLRRFATAVVAAHEGDDGEEAEEPAPSSGRQFAPTSFVTRG